MNKSADGLTVAWESYRDKMQELRGLLEADPRYVISPLIQSQANSYLYQVQATTYNMAIAAHADYPRFNTQQLFEPIYSWLAPNPDFIYSRTIVNPRRRYRITGRVGDLKMIVFQKQSTLFGYDMVRLGSHEISDFAVAADGRFDIIAGAEQEEGNWLPLDRSHEVNVISVRRAMASFEDDVGDILIEPMDHVPEKPAFVEPDALIKRIAHAASIAEFTTKTITLDLYYKSLENGGLNQPWTWGGKAGAAIGGADAATYSFVNCEIPDGEALIVEAEVPPCKYWGAQMNDLWMQTLDYAYHQSSLSMGQAVLDQDGWYRMVLTKEDPGVANWIDMVGNTHGIIVLRWYEVERFPQVKVRKIKLTELSSALPPGAKYVTPEERATVLRARQRAVYKIYNT